MKHSSLSVVVPTYNRTDVLERTIRAYVQQADPPQAYEIIVVNDGSTDGTKNVLDGLAREFPGMLRVLHQQNAGPGMARNRAIYASMNELILFAGDDVVPSRGLVRAHLTRHAAYEQSAIAVLGKIEWSEETETTPFMHWLEHGGPQFAFGSVNDGQDLPPQMFYTSNISVPRAYLLEHGLFDERFRSAGWEDVDLGMRLVKAGMRIIYAADAGASHIHPTDFRAYANRISRIGYYHALLIGKHGLAEKPKRFLAELLKLAVGSVLRRVPVQGLRERGYRWHLSWIEYQSMRRYWRETGRHV